MIWSPLFLFSTLNLLFLITSSTNQPTSFSDGSNKYIVRTSEELSPAISVKFRSLILREISMWFDNGDTGVYQGILKFGQETTITSYPGHQFFFKYTRGTPADVIARVEITEKQVLYVIFPPEDSSPSGSGDKPRNPVVEEYKKKTQSELDFTTQYYKTTGRHWLHYFNTSSGKPRPPPILPMWPSETVGFVRPIESEHLYWMCSKETEGACRANSLASCDPSSFESQPETPSPLSPSASSPSSLSYLSTIASRLAPSLFPPPVPSPPLPKLTMHLQTISTAPRAFLIENFLSSFETDELIRLASPHIQESVIGQADSGGIFKSTTRTSSNTWLPRSTSPLIETIFCRVADALGIDQSLLTFARNAEDIQVVHYNPGEEYQAHYDWGVRGYPESRFITMLLYLSDPTSPPSSSSSSTSAEVTQEATECSEEDEEETTEGGAGGETSFPKAGFKIIPKRGNAVIFYSLLEDGNGDKDSLHASLPVRFGEKWLANFWVWDPELTEAIRATRRSNSGTK